MSNTLSKKKKAKCRQEKATCNVCNLEEALSLVGFLSLVFAVSVHPIIIQSFQALSFTAKSCVFVANSIYTYVAHYLFKREPIGCGPGCGPGYGPGCGPGCGRCGPNSFYIMIYVSINPTPPVTKPPHTKPLALCSHLSSVNLVRLSHHPQSY